MSLRYKALIAVVVLVAFLTGFLVVSSSNLFEQDARNRIRQELRKDKQILSDRIRTASRISRTGMKASATSSEMVQLFNESRLDTLDENLLPFAREWRRDAEGDIAIAAIDSYVADDKGARRIGRAGEDLAFVALVGESDPAARERILNDPELTGFLSRFYEQSYSDSPGELPAYREAVLPVAGRVYLVVQHYLWESVQERLAVGVGVVMTELSREWLERTARDAGGRVDEIEKIVFAGRRAAASTVDPEAAQNAVDRGFEAGAKSAGGDAHPFEFEHDGGTHLGIAFRSSLTPEDTADRPGFIAFKSLEREMAPFNVLRTRVALTGAGLGLLAAVVAYFGAYLVIAKLRRLQDATVKIREGRFDTQVRIRGRDELGKLGKAFNDMTTGLKALGMYTHETLAKNLLDNPELLTAKSTRREGSIFFSDIKGFTGISERLGADELTEQLNEYFAALGEKLREQRGYLDKFIGDSIMAFWGPPFVETDDYAVRACRTAMESLNVARALREEWQRRGRPLFFQRIGISTGEVVIGNVGTETKKNFTVIGDSVNVASRLEGANKVYGTEILVDERTYDLARESIAFREVDQLRVVGREQPVRIFEPLAEPGGFEDYERALAHYRVREFDRAIVQLNAMLESRPGDGPSLWLRGRCDELKKGVPEDWEPVTTATTK